MIPEEERSPQLRYYHRNLEVRREATRVWHRSRRELIQRIKLEAGCIDCGYNEHAEALDFDHIDGKTATISALRAVKMDRLLAEIAKCEVRCANCHRVRTRQRQLEKDGVRVA